MERIKEKQIYLEMLGDLVKQRRVITEEILLVRNRLDTLDKEIEQHKEYMSAAEYINIRNSIRNELEIEMREQVKNEILAEQRKGKVEEVPSPSVIPAEVIEESKFVENQKAITKDVSFQTVVQVIKTFLKESGRPVSFDELHAHLEENRNHTWNRKAFSQIMWRAKNEDERIENPTRGFYQYR